MAKFKDIEIQTKQVYLNIEKNEEVETKGMTTQEAIATYGDMEVLEVGDPQYTTVNEGTVPTGRKGKRENEDPRKPGTTNVRLKA